MDAEESPADPVGIAGGGSTGGINGKYKWPDSLETEGLCGETVLKPEVIGWGEKVEVVTTFENIGPADLFLPESIVRACSPIWAIDVRFEDGYECERRVTSEDPWKSDPDGKGTLRLKVGERVEVRFDLASEVRMSWVGRYTCKLGLDLTNEWGRGEKVRWLSPIKLAVGPASNVKLEGMMSSLDLTREWGDYNADDIARATDSGDIRLLERARALAQRAESAIRSGFPIPGRTEGEAALGPTKIEVLTWARAERWRDVAAYVKANRGDYSAERRFGDFVAAAYRLRLDVVSTEKK